MALSAKTDASFGGRYGYQDETTDGVGVSRASRIVPNLGTTAAPSKNSAPIATF
jgi:hypothetical protein